jgi:bifunctional DNA-binding transcriptional regulator/antitoxin component of YhaV-PrlF toxin-antitoxin module
MTAKEKRVFVDKKGRITLPAAFLKALEMKGGDPIVVCIQRDELRITTIQARIVRATTSRA